MNKLGYADIQLSLRSLVLAVQRNSLGDVTVFVTKHFLESLGLVSLVSRCVYCFYSRAIRTSWLNLWLSSDDSFQ